MNPEEFDKRLSESFKSEYLPPDKQLWQNISTRLDQGSKKPFWYWLAPVVIAVVAIGGWLMSDPFKQNEKLAVSNTQVSNEASKVTVNETESTVNSATESPASETSIPAPVETPLQKKTTSQVNTSTPVAENGETGKTIPAHQPFKNRNPFGRQGTSHFTTYFEPAPEPVKTDLYPTFLRMKSLIPPVVPQFMPDKESPIAYDAPFKDKPAYRSPYSKHPANFNGKWYLSAGIGPQVAFNKAIVPNDSQAWVHKELWANRGKMTGNSGGFQSNVMLGRKLGEHFSIEAGLQYSLHSEDIRFSFTSYDIESRDNNNKITRYDGIQLWIRVWNPSTMQYDTTFYDATRGFSLSVKNRYQIFTIPVKFNYEYNISDRTKFFLGVGAGFSAITTQKATHLNLIHDKETTERKVRQYTASFNTQFGFFTNFNDIGQLGVYSGFQMYAKPFGLSNKQYAISMSDLQLGIAFRRPLNW